VAEKAKVLGADPLVDLRFATGIAGLTRLELESAAPPRCRHQNNPSSAAIFSARFASSDYVSRERVRF